MQTRRMAAHLRNMFYYVVLQRCSFFVLFKNQNALHIIFYTIIELGPPPCKLLLCIYLVVQNALICINYARFQVPVPGSGSRFRFLYRCIVVSLYRFLVVACWKTGRCYALKVQRNMCIWIHKNIINKYFISYKYCLVCYTICYTIFYYFI
jgi:hypothetical protein